MKRALGMTAVVMLFGSVVHAQYLPPQISSYGGQSSTPYVNLLQRNVNPAVTYMGIVQPQLQAQANFQQLQNEINLTRMMPSGVAPPRNTGISDTGAVPARFMQFHQYYNTMANSRRVSNQTQPGLGVAGFNRR
jgi:hypothetical protein